jgi:hypothetical protein
MSDNPAGLVDKVIRISMSRPGSPYLCFFLWVNMPATAHVMSSHNISHIRRNNVKSQHFSLLTSSLMRYSWFFMSTFRTSYQVSAVSNRDRAELVALRQLGTVEGFASSLD